MEQVDMEAVRGPRHTANPVEVLANASRYLRRIHGRRATKLERRELWWAQKQIVAELFRGLRRY